MTPLDVQQDGALVRVDLRRSPANAIDGQTLDQLDALCERVERDASVRAVQFTSSAPKGFGEGADLTALAQALADGTALDGWVERAHRVFARLDRLPVLTVGVLRGVVLGGALEWALCLDVLVAEQGCRLGLPELRLGLVPGFGGLARLERRCGQGLARELLLTGRTLGARRAFERGLVDHRVPAGEGVSLADALCLGNQTVPRAVTAAAKALLAEGVTDALHRERVVLRARLADPVTKAALQHTLTRSDPWKHLPSSTP